MGKIYKNRYYIAFIISLCIVLLAIVAYQSYYNLKDLIQAPSERWGRTISLGVSDLYKKQPSVLVNDQYVEILAANKTDFTALKFNRETRETSRRTFKIKGVDSYKVQQFEWDDNNVYFIADNNLYFVSENSGGGYSAKLKIADSVKDFNLLSIEGKTTIIAATEKGIGVYMPAQSSFTQVGPFFEAQNIAGISSIVDNKGIIHTAAYAEASSVEFPIYYAAFEQDKWTLLGSKVEKSLSESWGINNIDIGLDDTDAYIFYEMAKWDQRGLSAKVYYTFMPLYVQNTELKFERLYLFEQDASNSNSYLSEPRTVKAQGDVLKLSVVRDTYDKKYSSGFSSYIAAMDQGKIVDKTRATRNQRLVTHTVFSSYKGEDILVYLDAAGSFNYEAFYTETGKGYIESVQKATREDYFTAVQNTLPGYVATLLLMIIKFTIYFPAILWFLMIEFFEIRSLKERPKLTFTIGIIIYIAVKLIAFGTYYTQLSMAQMPPELNFRGAYYFYSIGIALLALFIEKLLKKHNPEMNPIMEYIIFALIDIQTTNMLYATYLT